MIPPDIAMCDDCIADIFMAGGRYEGYWATSCVNCGPRYSIISEIPYDRERTSMRDFPMCPQCSQEYGDPLSRRHHAQTIACAACGPSLELLDTLGNRVTCPDPIHEAAALLTPERSSRSGVLAGSTLPVSRNRRVSSSTVWAELSSRLP